MSEQSRLVSLIESVCNTGSGFLVSLVVWQWIVAPAYGYHVTLATNLGVTGTFTIVSVLRGYAWRRFFARGLHRTVVRVLKGREA